MKFLKKTLQDNEKPVCRTGLHVVYLVAGLFWFVCLSAIGWISDYELWVRFGSYIPVYEIDTSFFQFGLTPGWIGGLFTLAGAVILLSECVQLLSSHLVITTNRLVYKTGMIRVKVNATEIADILGAHVDQGWFGQFFGYGKLRLDCRFIEDVEIPYIKNPYGVVKALQKIRHAKAEHAPHATEAQAAPQPVSQTLIQISGNNPIYIVDKIPSDDRPPLRQLPKALGDNMLSAFRKKA